MAYGRTKFVQQVFRLGISVQKLRKEALVLLPCKIKGYEGKEEGKA